METILAHAQKLVSTLSSLMPTPYQKDNLKAMLALFLEAQGHPCVLETTESETLI